MAPSPPAPTRLQVTDQRRKQSMVSIDLQGCARKEILMSYEI